MLAFCGRILALGRWNLQVSWCKCPGVPQSQPPGMATDKCIRRGCASYEGIPYEEALPKGVLFSGRGYKKG